jgi:hypothetical protein
MVFGSVDQNAGTGSGSEWRDEAAGALLQWTLPYFSFFREKRFRLNRASQDNHIWDLMRQSLDWPFVSAGLWDARM